MYLTEKSMKEIPPFKFERTRGIVWVCDIEKSSTFLNDPDLIDDIESFLPRFYYISKLMVETFGGEFIKWTGDGFLAFFKVELERDLFRISENIFEAAWHLSFMSSITQMGLSPKKKIWIRHGITYEQDALVMKIQSEGEKDKLDIIGKAVVLAFRLSSIEAPSPSIITVKELIQKNDSRFIAWKPTKEESLRFFKGEKYGTQKIRISGHKEKKITDWGAEGKRIGKNISSRIKKIRSGENKQLMWKLIEKMDNGPDWCREISAMEKEIIQPVVDSFNDLISIFRKNKKEKLKDQ
jgi:hypothetical protein